jgi:hypothetical protein
VTIALMLLMVLILVDGSKPEPPLATGLETCYADVLSMRTALPYPSSGPCTQPKLWVWSVRENG